MLLVNEPIAAISGGKLLATDDQQILCVPFLSGLCEIERTCDHCFVVDDRYLVVCDGMSSIDQSGDASRNEEIDCRVLLTSLAFV